MPRLLIRAVDNPGAAGYRAGDVVNVYPDGYDLGELGGQRGTGFLIVDTDAPEAFCRALMSPGYKRRLSLGRRRVALAPRDDTQLATKKDNGLRVGDITFDATGTAFVPVGDLTRRLIGRQ